MISSGLLDEPHGQQYSGGVDREGFRGKDVIQWATTMAVLNTMVITMATTITITGITMVATIMTAIMAAVTTTVATTETIDNCLI